MRHQKHFKTNLLDSNELEIQYFSLFRIEIIHIKLTMCSDCLSGSWTRTSDLRVMSPTSYLLLYPVIQLLKYTCCLTASNYCQNEQL